MMIPGYYLYSFEDPQKTGISFYIGKGKGRRALNHFGESDRDVNTFLYNKIQKLKCKGLKPDIFILRDGLTEKQALYAEVIVIAIYGRRNKGLGPLCNLTDGADGISGYKFTEEQRKKQSVMMMGRQNAKGYQYTEDQKHHRSLAMMGKQNGKGKRTAEQNKINSLSKSKEWEITFPDGHTEIIRNLTQFCMEHNLFSSLMCLVAQGKRKHHKGFKCRKVN